MHAHSVRLLALAAVVAITLIQPALGKDEFDQAVDAWLQNNDEDSLPKLAALATAGHRDAKLILGRIEFKGLRLHSKSESRQILRAPLGRYGQSWLDVLYNEGDEFATLLWTIRSPPYDVSKVRRLVAYGESNEASNLIVQYKKHGPMHGVADLLGDVALPANVRAAAFLSALDQPADVGETPKLLQANVEQFPLTTFSSERLLSAVSGPLKKLMKWMQGLAVEPEDPGRMLATSALRDSAGSSPEGLRLLRFCERRCSDDVSLCMADTVAFVGGYMGMMHAGSPLESVISEERYIRSPRFEFDLSALARAHTSVFWTSKLRRRWAGVSCAAVALEVE